MDFPLFHLDFFGDRSLIAVMGAVHVIVNHMLAVGGIPLVVALEWWGCRTKDPRFDVLARRIMFVFFITATTVGALTGVGMWLSVGLVNPEALGSLLRVFFWVWFAEWLVFVSEVVLICWYYLSWDRLSGERKAEHLRLGLILCVFSWITMALIVAILGFMMNPGSWLKDHQLINAIFNDIYIPQLAFRTPLAMVMAGCAGLGLVACFTPARSEMRIKGLRFVGIWMLIWLPICALALVWYYHVVPPEMINNLPVALGTQHFELNYAVLKDVLFGLVAIVVLFAVMAATLPGRIPAIVFIIPVLAVMVLAGTFERSREFVRKPYVIYQYMYANRFRVEDYALLNHEGILANSTYAKIKHITNENRVQAGSEIFQIACATCHTVGGVNSIRDKVTHLYGNTAPWPVEALEGAINALHGLRAYMPPFPGNEAEAHALALYIASLQRGLELAPPELQVAGHGVGQPPVPTAAVPAEKSH